MDWGELEHRLRLYSAKGAKGYRRRQVAALRALIAELRGGGCRHPSQIARKAVYGWIEASNSRQRYYAARVLWQALDRGLLPPPVCLTQRGGGAAP